MGKSTISMAIFNSYVSVPEGTMGDIQAVGGIFDRCNPEIPFVPLLHWPFVNGVYWPLSSLIYWSNMVILHSYVSYPLVN